MRIIKILVLVGAGLAALGYGGFHYFFKLAVPGYTGILELPGLGSGVTVKTDDHGVPHIFADNERDLFFAQGFITARERLFQMDMTRLAGRGELSSIFGERTLDRDKFLKTIGFYRQAKKNYSVLSDETRKILRAYADGVNAYIDTCDHLPREYVFLKAKPMYWTPEDSVVTTLLMSYSLTRSKKVDLILNRIRAYAGDGVLQAIMPSYPKFAPVLAMEKKPVPENKIFPEFASAGKYGEWNDWEGFPMSLDIAASNWMIFSPEMTGTGKAMFAGSPDLSPTLPGLFYLVRIKGGSFDVMGGALPGVPGIGPLGFNGNMAWSAVNGRGDELDYFVEKINPEDDSQYLTESGYQSFTVVQEVLKVRGDDGIKEINFPVRISRHGPMISDVMGLAPENCAMQWTGLELTDRSIDGLMALNRAGSFEEFRSALKLIRTMNLNLGYADAKGDIGWQFTAGPPIRKKGQGTLPVPGWTGEYDWEGFIPFEDLPWDKNPERGYAASFNNEPGNVDFHLTHYYLFERAIRFENIMEARGGDPVVFADLKDMQLDRVSVVAQRWVPVILDALKGAAEFSMGSGLLGDWDCSIDIKSPAATLFNFFYYQMMKNTLMDEVGKENWDQGLGQEYLYYIPDLVLTRIMTDANNTLFDDKTTTEKQEMRDDMIRKSMGQALSYLIENFGDTGEKWEWGLGHRMHFTHPLGEKLFFLNPPPVSTHGSHHTINSGFWSPKEPFKMTSGGVIRMMVDFKDVDASSLISPPGQSGHYLSPHYDDLIRTWALGDQIPMEFGSAVNLSRTLSLVPSS